MAKKSRTHKFVITIVADRACTKTQALEFVRDCIHGEFYPYQRDIDTDAGEFRVKSFNHLPAIK